MEKISKQYLYFKIIELIPLDALMKWIIPSALFLNHFVYSSPPSGMKFIPSQNQTFLRGIDTVSFTYNYFMDSTEVTQKSYHDIMSQVYPDYTPPAWASNVGKGDLFPVHNISWCDAVLYCIARSLIEGKEPVYTFTSITGSPGNSTQLNGFTQDLNKNGYRLPTDAEWAFAAHGGFQSNMGWKVTNDYFPENASDTAEVNSHIVYAGNSNSAQVVASKLPNAYGLYDMQGNIYEWTNEWFSNLTGEKVIDPVGPSFGMYFTLRGGSWNKPLYFSGIEIRVAADYADRFNFVGFRSVAKDLSTLSNSTLSSSSSSSYSSSSSINTTPTLQQPVAQLQGNHIQLSTTQNWTLDLIRTNGEKILTLHSQSNSIEIPSYLSQGYYILRIQSPKTHFFLSYFQK